MRRDLEPGGAAVGRLRLATIALVILDLSMPNLDGRATFEELIRIEPGVRVILSSGYNEPEVTGKFPGQGLAGFIKKPYKLAALREVLRRLDA